MSGERIGASDVTQQDKLPELTSLFAAGEFLFPQKEVNLRLLFEKIKPPPTEEQPLFLIRMMNDESARGFLVGAKKPLIRELKIYTDNLEDVAEKMGKRKIGGIVLFVEPGELEKTEEAVALLTPLLKHGQKTQGKLWVLEKTLENQKPSLENVELRKGLLKAYGLVARRVAGVRSDYLLWYGRKEKETASVEFNLTEHDKYKKEFKRRLNEMLAKFKQDGWLVDASEITELCRHSKFMSIKRNLGWLSDGRCVKVFDLKGNLLYEIDSSGSWKEVPGFHDEEGEGVLRPIKRDEVDDARKVEAKVELMVGRTEARGMTCNKCHGQLFFDRRVKGETENGKFTEVVSDLICPSCPSGSSIKSTRILRFSKS